MTDIVIIALIISNFGLLLLVGWLDHTAKEERSKLLNAAISKSPEQFRDLNLTDKVVLLSILFL